MPFSPDFKAGLVTVALAILNHVPRLGAAPMKPWQALAEGFRQATNSVEDHAGPSTAMNRLFSQQTWIPAGTPDIGVQGAKLRLREGRVLHDTALSRAQSRSNAAPRARDVTAWASPPAQTYDVDWWTRTDPRAWIDSPQWLRLDGRAKTTALDAFGPMVFSEESYRNAPVLDVELHHGAPNLTVRKASQLQRRLVEEYLKVRWANLAPRIEVNLDGDALPGAKRFFTKLSRAESDDRVPARSALELDQRRPGQSFSLGGFVVHLYLEETKSWAKAFPSKTVTNPARIVVVASAPGRRRLYLGKTIAFQPDP